MIVNSKKFKGRHEFNVKTRISIKIGSKKKKPELLQKKKEVRFLREKPRWVF
jgi:hypothetical protein